MPTGTYLQLDQSAALIFDLLADSDGTESAADRLAQRVRIPPEQAEADVKAVVDALGGLRRTPGRPPRRPGLVSGWREVARWWGLPWALRLAVARVVVLLCLVEIAFWAIDIKRLSSLLGTPLAEGTGPSLPEGSGSELDHSERRLLAAVDWVARRWLFPGTCLRRALLTGHFLRRRRPVLRLGLMADGVTAHAWVEVGGATYGFEDVTGVFQPLRSVADARGLPGVQSGYRAE
ncbi:MAG: lasso peptide biosynthesis B2 protein [Acidimicrobiales bacterium]